MTNSSGITELLQAWQEGDGEALNELMPLVMDELKKIAGNYLRREKQNHTLQSTALVNELYLKLVNLNQLNLQNRAHFFAISATCMRRILVDYARTQTREKRGKGVEFVPLDDLQIMSNEKSSELITLDDALKALEKQDKQKSQIVEMRYFGGMTVEEIAEVLGLSERSVQRHWQMAKVWLAKEIS